MTTINKRTVLSAIAVPILALVIRNSIKSYSSFIARGPGGAPSNVFGWAFVTCLEPLALSTKNVHYTGDYTDGPIFLTNLSERKGPPAIAAGLAPHRQMTQNPGEDMRESIENILTSFQHYNTDTLFISPSKAERHDDALFVSELTPFEDLPQIAQVSRREIGHIHGDLSLHFYFSPADAKSVIEKGWGERHRLTTKVGEYLHVGRTLIMIYGPRNEQELEIVKKMVGASVQYMTGKSVVIP